MNHQLTKILLSLSYFLVFLHGSFTLKSVNIVELCTIDPHDKYGWIQYMNCLLNFLAIQFGIFLSLGYFGSNLVFISILANVHKGGKDSLGPLYLSFALTEFCDLYLSIGILFDQPQSYVFLTFAVARLVVFIWTLFKAREEKMHDNQNVLLEVVEKCIDKDNKF